MLILIAAAGCQGAEAAESDLEATPQIERTPPSNGVPADHASVQSAAATSLPVTVVNGAGQPVPTSITGTPNVQVVSMPNVSGTVGIAGTPNVQVVSMPNVSIAGTPNVQVVSMPKVEVAGTPNVQVVSMPKVEIAGTVSSQILSMPKVEIAGTPTVNVANFPGGQGAVTALVVQQKAVLQADQAPQALAPIDISAYHDVRVVAVATGVTDYAVTVEIVDDAGGPALLLDPNIIDSTGTGSRVYAIPGRKIMFELRPPSFGGTNVTISVYGR